jgi:hypothetical protein
MNTSNTSLILRIPSPNPPSPPKKKLTSQKLCYIKIKNYYKNSNIPECNDSKTKITEILKSKTSLFAEQIQPATLKHNSRTPGCEKLSSTVRGSPQDVAVTDCAIKIYKMDNSYVRSNRDSQYDIKTSASNPFMLQFVKFTSGITVSSPVT